MEEITHEKLRKIKQSFRLYMSGPTAHSMGQKGVSYKINWGVPLPELQKMAVEYGKDEALALALWQENIRECKILATLIIPVKSLTDELLEAWGEQVNSQEMAELLAFNLLQYWERSPQLAYKWMVADNEMMQIMAYQLLARLFVNGHIPTDADAQEYLSSIVAALKCKHVGVRHAATNSLHRFMDLGEDYQERADIILQRLDGIL
ncbi:DNA alkylation repair protein [Prevotella sp. S7 MS 2]|uniref:DNA alkylation repair protein n=1 Tax=Prevotella sp. S7 MS 2 TaxID=1287488 RepID=UPI000513121B|nr:DNA alkylation repair protein [Prevotella sp. S7 MS 2]KGI60189.1 peptidase [Prevotella sp. S7 MS 2]